MKPELEKWINRCALAPGMFGCGVRLPDGTCVGHNFNELCPLDFFNEALRCLAELPPVFSSQGLFPRWFTWKFEQGLVRVALRPDGLLLALAIKPSKMAGENLDALTGEFFELKLSA